MNKKKFFIGIILVLFITFAFLGVIIVKNKKDQRKIGANANNLQEENKINDELSSENIVLTNEIEENNIISNDNISVADKNTEIAENEKENMKETSKKEISSNSNINKTESNFQTKQSTPKQMQVQSKQEETKPKQNTEEKIHEQQTKIDEKISEIPKQPVELKAQSTEPISQTKQETKEEGPKYIRNDAMINKIKQVIISNETQNMKDFGYNIVVDSSIKNSTNQFTYAESRVINSIKNAFGTIRIYAEDYYYNGQLIMTECYIF